MSKRSRQRELERLRAKRKAERRRRQRRRALLLYGAITPVLTASLVWAGVWWVGRDDGPASAASATTAATPTTAALEGARADFPSAPATVACGGELPGQAERQTFEKAPPPADPGKRYQVTLVTSCGDITMELDPKAAPQAVGSFVFLAREGYYDATWFHRITKTDPDGIAVVQGGDGAKGDGTGGPGYQFADELPKGEKPYKRGTVAMANNGKDTNGSQFFISYEDNDLPANYTLFGRVTEGMDVVDRIAQVPVNGQTPTEAVWIEDVKVEVS